MALVPGDRLGPYEIIAPLGAGGMGEVYRARDQRLGRDVAIKVLPQSETGDSDRKRRFIQEARAASALNHPNIVTLHDIASDDGRDYIVMELVAGKSLDQVIRPKGISVHEAAGYASQIADALAAAHAAGIVHRDIKPSNVIVDGHARVKVLDFGLAKLTSTAAEGDVTMTSDGMIVGTVAYMSPEQASGRETDHRSDIFSLGVMLYELLSGRRPFSRNSPAETMSAIITDGHPPLAPSAVPAKLGEIVDKALEKDPHDRYQSAADLAVDLRRFLKTASGMLPGRTSSSSAVASGAPAVSAAPQTRRPWMVAAPVAIAAALLGAGVAWFARPAVSSAPQELLANAQFTRLTDFPGDESSAAISPDGKFVVLLSDREGRQDVWLTQVGTGQFQNLTKGSYQASNATNRDAGFSADGTQIWLSGPPPLTQRMRVMPLVGGSWRPFLGERTVGAAWSPDGSRIAYFTIDPGDPLFVADKDGGNARQIFVEKPGLHNHFPVWSRDGQWIYFVHGNIAVFGMDLWRISANGGTPEALTHIERNIGYPAPLDAHTVLYVAEDQDGSGPWLWTFDVDRKVARRVGYGLDHYRSIAATADGRRLVATIANPVANLWTVPILDRQVQEKDVTAYPVPNVRAVAPRFAQSALFYLSSQGGGDGLWRLQDGHADEVWKGAQGSLAQPAAISNDGRSIALVLRKSGKQTLWLLGADGTPLPPIGASLDIRGTPAWSPDSKWVVTGGVDAKGQGLFKVPAAGGDVVRLVSGNALNPVWSPDGTLIVYAGTNTGGIEPLLAVRPDGTPVDLPPIRLSPAGERMRFTPDGKSLVYMQGTFRAQDFWLLDLATKTSHALTHLDNPATMRTFDLTPDGRQIVFDRQRENADLVLIDLPKDK